MPPLTHRAYFRRFQLNAAQYGEILVAGAFQGRKMGDTQRGYDILVNRESFQNALRAANLDSEPMLISVFGQEVRIQVRSKLLRNPSGNASVVHCKSGDLEAMTHLAVILVRPGSRIPGDDPTEEGQIAHAWLMSRDTAAVLREKKGKEQYIAVNQLTGPSASTGYLLDIRQMLSSEADKSIESEN
jgi:hypothetical protein